MARKMFSSWWLPIAAALTLGPLSCGRYVNFVFCMGGAGSDQEIVGRAAVAEICGESSVRIIVGAMIGVVVALSAAVGRRKRLNAARLGPASQTGRE